MPTLSPKNTVKIIIDNVLIAKFYSDTELLMQAFMSGVKHCVSMSCFAGLARLSRHVVIRTSLYQTVASAYSFRKLMYLSRYVDTANKRSGINSVGATVEQAIN